MVHFTTETAAEKFTLIPSGVEPEQGQRFVARRMLRELRLPADAKLIGVVGRSCRKSA